jgi:PGF-CTERM protein
MASWEVSPAINDSIKVYFNPTVVSWFGSVVDTYGNAQGGIPVVLHVGYLFANSSFAEVYTLNQTTLPDKPYPGTYVFDNIVLWSNITTAYASAQWTIQDNVVITGKSDLYSLNKSRTSAGFIVLHVPLPDAIKVSANPDIILVGGDTSIITAQLYLNGNPYRRPNVPITFFGDNDTRAYLPTVKTNLSDANGAATILLTSNMTKGRVNITAFSQVTVVNNLTATCFVDVVGWGTISGMVTDKNKNGVPNATVKLWRTVSNDSGVWSTTLYASPENPQQTVSRPEVAAIGTYTYYRIPSGIYNVTAEKADASGNNHIWFAIVNLTVGTATNNVAIPDLVIATPSTPTPTVTATVTAAPATPTPTATPIPTATPSPGFETVFAVAGLLGVAYLIARKEH